MIQKQTKVESPQVFADPSSERAVLGSMMLDPSCIETVSGMLNGGDFADPLYGRFFHWMTMAHAAGKPIREIGWVATQGSDFGLEGNFWQFVTEIQKDTGTAANVLYFAEVVRQKSDLRALDATLARFSTAMRQTDVKPLEVVQMLNSELVRMECSSETEATNLGDVLELVASDVRDEMGRMDEAGVTTGIDDLDRAMGPMRAGEVIVIAARPGCGKTSMAWQVCNFNAKMGRRSLVMSLEMPKKELATRHACQRAEINLSAVRRGDVTPEQLQRIERIAQEDANLPVMLSSPSRATLSRIEAEARYCKHRGGLQLLVIDYIGLIAPEKYQNHLQRYDQLSDCSQKIKQLSKELGCPILLLCQLGREAASGPPMLQHLRGTGAIEQDADVVLLLDNPAKRGEQVSMTKDGAFPVQAIIAKHRHGSTGAVPLLFYGSSQMFADPPKANRIGAFDEWNG